MQQARTTALMTIPKAAHPEGIGKMTEQQLEAMEKLFPNGGLIVFREPNSSYRAVSFGSPACPAMNELLSILVDPDADDEPGLLLSLLNSHYPQQ